MATVHQKIITTVKGIPPGAKKTKNWKAGSNMTYSFFPVPRDAENNPNLEYKAQIENVRCVTTGSFQAGTHSTKVYFDVRNFGTSTVDVDVWMIWVEGT